MYRIWHEWDGKKLKIDIDGNYGDAKEIAKDRVKTCGGMAWVIDTDGETKYFVSMELTESEYS